MKSLFVSCFISFIYLSAIAQKKADPSVIISGKVKGDTKGYNTIYFYSSGTGVDSSTIKNGHFTISLPFKNTFTQLFYTQYETSGGRGYRPFPILIDQPGTIYIDMDIKDGFYKSEISGSRTASLYHKFILRQSLVNDSVTTKMEKLFGPAWYQRDRPDVAEVNEARVVASKEFTAQMIKTFIRDNPGQFVSAFALGMAKYSMDVVHLREAFQLLAPQMQRSKEGKETAAFISGLESANEGQTVQNFTLTNEKGTPFNFAQLRGKYVWIDFWASWCGPCKKAFPDMRELYAKYRGNNFEILGISADETQEPWLKAVNEFNNPWPQIWDDKTVAAQFAVSAYPTSFLIDPNGKIILKEVGFEPGGRLEKKLQEIFGK